MRFQPFDKPRLPLSQVILAAAVLAILGLVALPAIAQEEAEPKKERTVIKATMHIDVSEAESVLRLLGVHYALKPDQNLIVLRGESYAVETAIKVIDVLDEPRPSIDLHVHVLSASKQGQADVPKDLEAAVGQLRNIFGYSGFEVLDTIMLRVLEGRQGRTDGGIRLGDNTARNGYRFSFQKISVVPDDGFNNIRIKGLKFDVSGQGDGSSRASLMTDVQIREGQKAVVGSSTPQGDGETLILIVEATASPDLSWKSESR